jgi:ribosomal protein S18 acetylase RimI-like enzyme
LIRPITHEDAAAVIELAVTSGLFPADETEVLDKMLAGYFGGNRDDGHMCIIDEEGEPRGVAYYAAAPATDRTWYLTMIAVRSDDQGQGRGAALMRYVENALQASGQRVLLVETSGLPAYQRARAFYIRCGYEEEARIRDFYAAGEEMVVFRKVLNAE